MGKRSSKHGSSSNSDEEKDWLELRSRKVLQSETEAFEGSEKMKTINKSQKKRRRGELDSVEDIQTEDFEEILEKEDWLILRNRKILQDSGSDEIEPEKVLKSSRKAKPGMSSSVKRKVRAKIISDDGEKVGASSRDVTPEKEDWLELRSRKILQPEGNESGTELQPKDIQQQSTTKTKRRRKTVGHPVVSSSEDEVQFKTKSKRGGPEKKLAADDWLELRSRNILQSEKLEDDDVPEKSDDGKALPVQHEMKGQEQDGNKTEEDWLELRSRNILQSAGEEEGLENLDERSNEAVSTEKRKSKRGKTAETITESKTIFASELNKPVADSKLSQNLEEDHEKQTEEDPSEKTSTGALTEVSLSKENPELLEEDWLELRSRSVLQSSNVTDYEEEKQGEVLLPQFVTEEDDSSETLKTGNVDIEHQADERSGEALQIGKRRSKRGKGYSEIAESMSAET